MGEANVAVIGGGTIGNFIAYHLSRAGIQVDVFEENKQVGAPQHCSGLISISGLKKIGVWDYIKKRDLISNYIKGAKFISHLGVERKVYFDKPVAVVIDRIGYDKLLYDLAVNNGANYVLGSQVKKLYTNGEIHIKQQSSIIRKSYEVVVDAEGARRYLIRDLPGVNINGLLPALQLDVKIKNPRNLEEIRDIVELHFNVSDFFSWVIPLGDENTLRIGVATNSIVIPHIDFLKAFIKRKFGEYKVLRKFGGIVVSGGPIKRFVWDRVIAIGDAAGHVKPTTGGGVVLGSLGALIASEIIKNYLEGRESLESYQNKYLRFLKIQFFSMLGARKILNFLGVGGVNVALRLLPQVVFSNLKGDMDMQFKAFLKLVFPFIPIKSQT